MSNDLARQIAQSARQFSDPAERADYLDRVCRGIARLRADVERHLAALESGAVPSPVAEDATGDETRGDDAPATRAPEAAEGDTSVGTSGDGASERAGDRIGRYRLVKPLGEGGFGTVWKAEQVEPVKRMVALKIIKLGMDTEQVVVRFEQERQALALMDHPNVARVLDAGATARGRPYFVMDLVQGIPINEFCDEERLTVPQRLELFAQVCAAVQHAHMKGIIHRDLKPSNILVARRDGTPHATVIDFGIAKATSSKLTDHSLVTEAYQVIGTLQYMSPEQSQASPDIDTRTDVYSLGVILYELLTGSTPYDGETFQRAVLTEILRMIGEVDPPAPSAKITQTREVLPQVAETRGVESRRLATLLRGELDWIVLKAIEKDRARRYESAEAFAADVRRYLAGEEVTAAPPSAAYRLRKFVRRNRGFVAAGGAVAATLVAGIVAFAWQAGVARTERDDAIVARHTAEVERKRSEAVAGFMESVFEGIDPDEQSGRAGSLKDQFVARLDAVSSDLAKLDGDPLGRARLATALVKPLYSLGEYEKAIALCREALAIRVAELGESDPLTEGVELTLASTLTHAGRHDEALAVAERIRDRRLREGRTSDEWQDETDGILAMVTQAAGHMDRSIQHYEAIQRRAVARGGPDTKESLFRLHGLGAAYRIVGRTEEAVALLTDLLARRTALLGADHSETLVTANSLAVALTAANRHDEARKILEAVLASFSKRYPADHPYVLHCRMNIAGTLDESGRLPEALKQAEAVAALALASHGPDSVTTVEIRFGLAGLLTKSGRHGEAADLFEQTIPSMHRIWGAAHGVVASARRGYVQECTKSGQRGRAIKFLAAEAARIESGGAVAEGGGGPEGRSTLRLLVEVVQHRLDAESPEAVRADALRLAERAEKALGPKDEITLTAQHAAGRSCFDPATGKECLAWIERAHRGRAEVLGPDHEETLRSAHLHGAANWLCGNYDAAVAILREALAGYLRTLGPDADDTITTALDLGSNILETGAREDYAVHMAEWLPRGMQKLGFQHPHVGGNVEQFMDVCRTIERLDLMAPLLELMADAGAKEAGPDDVGVLRTRANAAACWFKAGRLDKSVPVFQDVVERARRVMPARDPQRIMAIANLAVNLRDAGRRDEAIPLFEEAIRDARSAGASAQKELAFATIELLRALAAAGRIDEVRASAAEILAAARRRTAAGSAALAGELLGLGTALLDGKLHAEAEPLLREVVEIRTKLFPDTWLVASANALHGEALLGLRRFAEAEPLVVSGCEGLVARETKMPAASRALIPKAKDRVLRLYAEWDAAEPGKGYDAKLAEWKAKFAAPAAGGK